MAMRSWPRAKAEGRGRDWSDLGEVVVAECLTTGHNVVSDRIVRLAAVLLDLKGDEDQELAVLEALVDPRIPIPAEATLLHGVASVHVAGQKHFGEIARTVRELIGDRPVVGFNVEYVAGFLDAEMRRHGRKTFYRANLYDVQAALHDAWGYWPPLSNAIARLGIRREEGSRTASNVLATARMARILSSASPDTLGNVPGDRWVGEDGDHGAEPATRPQLAAIRDLGGDPGMVKNTRQADKMIGALRSGMPEGVPAEGESAAGSLRGVLPGSKWVWLLVLGLAALAAWLFL